MWEHTATLVYCLVLTLSPSLYLPLVWVWYVFYSCMMCEVSYQGCNHEVKNKIMFGLALCGEFLINNSSEKRKKQIIGCKCAQNKTKKCGKKWSWNVLKNNNLCCEHLFAWKYICHLKVFMQRLTCVLYPMLRACMGARVFFAFAVVVIAYE